MSEFDAAARGRTRPHRLRRMTGRDPYEEHRTATPLELLFDLTFVIAFGISASEFAHLVAEHRIGPAAAGFAFSTFAVSWAWINFAWFASAYDTDDWVYRLCTMLQMVGVIVLALGIPAVYSSIAEGRTVDNRVLVAGYIVMRIAMVFQWLRASRQDPERRASCLTYVIAIVIAQIGWVVVFILHTSVPVTLALYAVVILLEFLGPTIAEKVRGGTPWHPHHIAERYSLLTIITLGEGVVGTVATVSAVVGEQGWTVGAALLAIIGTGLTFGMWWVYFIVPAAPLLHTGRYHPFAFGYGHIVIFGAIVATGAGLHAAAYYVQGNSELTSVETVLTVAIPVGIYLLCIFGLYIYTVRTIDLVQALWVCACVVVLVVAVLFAAVGVNMAVCLTIVMLAPVVALVGFEFVGHQRAESAINRAMSSEL